MKRFVRITTILFFSFSGFAQTFTTSPGVSVPNNTTVNSTQTVSGVGIIDCDYGLLEVCIDISHNRDRDLDIFLSDPLGNFYELTTDNGGTGNNYIVTCFDMTAATNVTAGLAPFNGSFIPEGNDLDLVNNGQDADGDWTLEVTDDASGTSGTLNSWSLVFGATPPCVVPSLEDCVGGLTVCSDETFTGNSSGSGAVVDLDASNDGCLSGENESSWYFFQAETDGDYAFVIETAVDYDFAVWGPYGAVTCPPTGAPIRCSYSGTIGNTGLRVGSGDNTEGSGGDAFVDPISALAGELYIIVIDNFSTDGTSYNLTWTLTGGAVLDCTLPIELKNFFVQTQDESDIISWSSSSELNNAYYTLEYSIDGYEWESIGDFPGAGNSSVETYYEYRYFPDRIVPLCYYRLSQTDFDGTYELLSTISVEKNLPPKVIRIVNLMGVEVDESYVGVKIYQYSDGSTKKMVSQ